MNLNALLLVIAGTVSAALGGWATFDQEFATRYVRTSPKAWLWRKMLGEARATVAVRRVFGPLAMVLGLGIAGLGVVFLARAA